MSDKKKPEPEPAPVLICRNCGSERITETWQVGVLECMECGAKGKADSGA